jgi:uncharacterized membrane protein
VTFADAVEWTGKAIDAAGVVVVVGGIVVASAIALSRLRRPATGHEVFRRYRQAIGRAILLGLELLVAADIIRTVAVDPTFRSVGVLAVIVAIRTFLSMTLELELEGRWPWQPRDPARG